MDPLYPLPTFPSPSHKQHPSPKSSPKTLHSQPHSPTHFAHEIMKPNSSSIGMHGSSSNQQKGRLPIKQSGGKRLPAPSFFPLLAPMLVLASTVCGLSEDPSPLISAPLGSQISCSERGNWVSSNGAFAFGFLGDTQKADDGFVVGIWHNIGNGCEKVPVWTVGGGVRVGENSTLQLSLDGSLVLFNGGPDRLPVWSSNTGGLGVRTATLMDNGNLVLMGFSGDVVWESFGCPTDTLLPGQPLRFPQSLQAASANSVASYYSLVVKSSGRISLVWENNVTYWSSHLSSSMVAREVRLEPNGLFGLFDKTGGLAWYRLSKDFREPSVEFRRLRIDADGNLRIYSWDNVSSTWRVGWQAVQNQCDVFGSCGLYSVCSYNSTGPVCQCLVHDLVSQECQKMADLGNCKTGISMSVFKQTVLYSLYPPHDVDTMLSLEACKEYCLNDSSCFAATARNDGSGICTIKRTSFISGYHHSSVPAVSFLKVCLVPEAVSAQAASLHENGRIPLPEQQPMNQIEGGHKNFTAAIAVLLLVTGLAFLASEMFVFWFVVYRRRQTNNRRRTPFCKDVQLNPHYSAVVRLSVEEVRELTKNFGSKLGPSVFKGTLPNKLLVTVKVLNNVVVSEKDFQMVVSTLGSTHHRNLAALKGFCCERNQKFLLYEYISNSSLDQWLLSKRPNRSKDTWHQRLNIAIGISRALAYLHLECKQCIAHGNLKLENVLLDENLVAKLTDFGLTSLFEKNDASSSETPLERDVYMFGEILLQIVTGKRGTMESKLCESAYQMLAKGELADFVDIHLEDKSEHEGVQRVMRLALWCMQTQPTLRPSIGEVTMILEGALSLDMPPPPVKTRQNADGNMDTIEVAL